MWDVTTHVALTFNDKNLPSPPYVNIRAIQLFMKKLRNRVPVRIKYYGVGEYGFGGTREINPHYHIVLYGIHPEKNFADIAESWTNSDGQLKCDIEQLKPVELTPELASYVCGYVAKKGKDDRNRWIDRNQAKIYKLFPKQNQEFATWSNGIGKEAIKKIRQLVVKYDGEFNTIRTGGKKYPLGRYLKQYSEGMPYANLKTGYYSEGYKSYAREIFDLALGQERAYHQRRNGKEQRKAKFNTERRSL